MSLTLGIFAILWRVVCVGLLVLVLTELTWAQRQNGHALQALRGVIASMIFVILFPLAAAVDQYSDFSPGIDLRPILERWVWITYAVLATTTLRFWLALHRWARFRRNAVSVD